MKCLLVSNEFEKFFDVKKGNISLNILKIFAISDKIYSS